jgi:hypothetical protein
MDKALRNTLIAGIIIVALSVGYYLVIFIPKREVMQLEQQKQEVDQQKQEQKTNALKEQEKVDKELAKELEIKTAKCLEDAKKFHQEYIKSISGYYFEPKYNYNTKLGRCLYSGGYRKNENLSVSDKDFDKKVKSFEYYWERVVKDVYTNETILSAYNFQDTETITARDKEMTELMSN